MTQIRRWAPLAGALAMGASLLLAAPTFAASNGAATGQTMTFEATAYGPSAQDNYPYGATDFFGQPLTQGDIAVDPTVIPLHSCVRVTGYSSPNLPAGGFVGEADDEGGAIKGKHIDIFMNTSEAQVNNFGIQHVQVTVLGKATNTSLSGTAACAAYTSGGSSSTAQNTSSGGSAAAANGSGNTASQNSGSGNAASSQTGGSSAANGGGNESSANSGSASQTSTSNGGQSTGSSHRWDHWDGRHYWAGQDQWHHWFGSFHHHGWAHRDWQ